MALERLDTPWVLFLNSGAAFRDSSGLARLVAVLEPDPEVGGVEPRLEDAEGRTEYSACAFPSMLEEVGWATGLYLLLPRRARERRDHDPAGPADRLTGACFLVRCHPPAGGGARVPHRTGRGRPPARRGPTRRRPGGGAHAKGALGAGLVDDVEHPQRSCALSEQRTLIARKRRELEAAEDRLRQNEYALAALRRARGKGVLEGRDAMGLNILLTDIQRGSETERRRRTPAPSARCSGSAAPSARGAGESAAPRPPTFGLEMMRPAVSGHDPQEAPRAP